MRQYSVGTLFSLPKVALFLRSLGLGCASCSSVVTIVISVLIALASMSHCRRRSRLCDMKTVPTGVMVTKTNVGLTVWSVERDRFPLKEKTIDGG